MELNINSPEFKNRSQNIKFHFFPTQFPTNLLLNIIQFYLLYQDLHELS